MPDEDKPVLMCTAHQPITSIIRAIGQPPYAGHEDGTRCTHRIRRAGFLIYDGAAYDQLTRKD